MRKTSLYVVRAHDRAPRYEVRYDERARRYEIVRVRGKLGIFLAIRATFDAAVDYANGRATKERLEAAFGDSAVQVLTSSEVR